MSVFIKFAAVNSPCAPLKWNPPADQAHPPQGPAGLHQPGAIALSLRGQASHN